MHRRSSQMMFNETFVNTKESLKCSHLISELIAKQLKPHTIGENLIIPACRIIARTMFGHEQKIMKIPLSDNTVSRRIYALSENIEKSVSFSIKETRFSLQLDEATDISGMAHLLAYIRFVYSGKITEQFLFLLASFNYTTQPIDMFMILNDYFNIKNISFANCIGICTDGTPSMSGRINGLVSLVKSKNNEIISSHCFLHR
ncbi:protein FAM200A-like [Octopus sinensis]|uniref:Protein FAM200A-like n=1 Tax=Octopus sinensis TaxID=2607531 RepID=A0A6P7TYY1_9MOLL|nr:protein FAM200A-like [Octopus sinensis]